MSRFCTVRTEFKDGRALVDALMETGQWEMDQIEIHHQPQHLFGYCGDQRAEKANIIIRRKHVGKLSNDIAFLKSEDGSYQAIISDYDKNKYGTQWNQKLKGSYAYHKLRRDQASKGRSVHRERLSNGRQRVTITGYR